MNRLRSVTLLPLCSLMGCTGELVELKPKGSDAGVQADQGGQVMDTAPAAVVGFDPAINNDIKMLGCTLVACHGGTTQPILVDDAAAIMTNYMNFKSTAMAGDQSLALTKNLSGSGVSHGGGAKFTSTSDPTYQRWLAWINAGNPLKAP